MCISLLLLVLSRAAWAEGTISPILTNGPTETRINIVFLAEGYLETQESQYLRDAEKMLKQILNTPPLNTYTSYFNAFAIFVASSEAGSDHPSRGVLRDTYFNSSYDSYGQARLITIPPNDRDVTYASGKGKVDALLKRLRPDYDVVVLIVNDPEYGGSGGTPLIASATSPSAVEIVLHELGHSYAHLGDEYDAPFPGYPEDEEPNTTRQTARTSLKWRDWIIPSTPIPTPETDDYNSVIGLFEGAHFHSAGWYRPKLDCKMQHLGVPFCEVCSEALVKSTYGLIRPIQSSSPANEAIIPLTDSEILTLSVTPLQPADQKLQVTWFTNGVPVLDQNGDFLVVGASALSPGTNQVSVDVSDLTPAVRTDPSLLHDRRTWVLDVQQRPNLQATLVSGGILLSWPASAVAFVLERTAALAEDPGWRPAGGNPTYSNGQFHTTFPTSEAAYYFRLRK